MTFAHQSPENDGHCESFSLVAGAPVWQGSLDSVQQLYSSDLSQTTGRNQVPRPLYSCLGFFKVVSLMTNLLPSLTYRRMANIFLYENFRPDFNQIPGGILKRISPKAMDSTYYKF